VFLVTACYSSQISIAASSLHSLTLTRMIGWLVNATSVFLNGVLYRTVGGNIHQSHMLGSHLHCREWLPAGRLVTCLIQKYNSWLVKTDHHLNHANLILMCHRLLNCVIVNWNQCTHCLYLLILCKMCLTRIKSYWVCWARQCLQKRRNILKRESNEVGNPT
jgi:hypothetical protein